MSRTTSNIARSLSSERSLQVDLWMIVVLGAAISALEQIVRLI